MKVELKVTKEYDVRYIRAEIGVRYWENATVNGIEEIKNNPTIPCRNCDEWVLYIDVDTGVIINWEKGVTALVHYKVCDSGRYTLLEVTDREIITRDGYVPSCLCPSGDGYGDYVVMDIDGDGKIRNFEFNPSYWQDEDE